MKISVLILAVGVLVSCNSVDPKLEKLQKENDSLFSVLNHGDSVMNSIHVIYGDIESNLSKIESKKARINELANRKKLSKEDKELIMIEMDSISQLLSTNKLKVATLENTVTKEEADKAGLGHIIKGMNAENSAEDEGIESMKRELVQISSDFSELFENYVYQEAENLEMQEKLSSASSELKAAQENLQSAQERLYSGWYVMGTKDELKSKGIVYTTGLLANKEVNEDFDRNLFKKVNTLDFKELILNGKKATIITTHPSESYELIGIKKKMDRLLIKNPEKFWSVSKFLIIEVE